MASNLNPIDQKVIVITSASRVIVLATALAAAEQGAEVALLAQSEETLNEIAMRYFTREDRHVPCLICISI